MLSWQVGRVKITRIVEMDLPIPASFMAGATPEALRRLPWLYPHFVSADDSTLNLSVHALLVEAPGLRLVVDTCVGNDRPREFTGGEALSTPFLAQLSEAGWSRDGVDAVVCTHLDVDHIGWNTNQTLTGGEAMIRAAQHDGIVRPDLDPALTIALMSGGIRQAMLGALTREDRPTPDALTEAIWSFMAAALRPAS
ncbi:MBL fold metallo-hydrolase [Devosia sp. LjRoot16]|uniref:MBL fold metallo-hydrolase n=1 Tax=Devosia sp. LjRoot16 TaxID=3342271 RepID=UPI003ED15D11